MTTPIFGIAAAHANSGKTTLICKLISELRRRGLTVAVLKHGRHLQLPDKDGSRFIESGADTSMLVTDSGWIIQSAPSQEPNLVTAAEILAQTGRYDLILVEGYKHESHPRLEICLLGESDEMTESPGVVGIIGEGGNFDRDDITQIADFIINYLNLN